MRHLALCTLAIVQSCLCTALPGWRLPGRASAEHVVPVCCCSTIYNMCTQKPPHDYSEPLYKRYGNAFGTYITDKVGSPQGLPPVGYGCAHLWQAVQTAVHPGSSFRMHGCLEQPAEHKTTWESARGTLSPLPLIGRHSPAERSRQLSTKAHKDLSVPAGHASPEGQAGRVLAERAAQAVGQPQGHGAVAVAILQLP